MLQLATACSLTFYLVTIVGQLVIPPPTESVSAHHWVHLFDLKSKSLHDGHAGAREDGGLQPSHFFVSVWQGWHQGFSDRGLTLPLRGLKCGFRGMVNANDL